MPVKAPCLEAALALEADAKARGIERVEEVIPAKKVTTTNAGGTKSRFTRHGRSKRLKSRLAQGSGKVRGVQIRSVKGTRAAVAVKSSPRKAGKHRLRVAAK